jgi:predicted DNA-binding ribbon-helix-helix protein
MVFQSKSGADGATQIRRRETLMKSPVIKHSVILNGHKTSVSLEDQFWDGLREIAAQENLGVSSLVERIDQDRTGHNLSSAIRVFVLARFRARTSQQDLPGDQANRGGSAAPGISTVLEGAVLRS